MIIQAMPYPAGGGGGGPAIVLGNTLAPATNVSVVANFQQGTAFLASESFTATKMGIYGPFTGTFSCNFRLCIYEVGSDTVWNSGGMGALVGQTAVQTGLGNLEFREIPLLASANIVAGRRYVPSIQPDSPGGSIGAHNGGGRAFSDSYADGPAATAGASFSNASSLSCIYISS